jgi:SNF2 family DNA or RNA helicase
MAAAGVHNTPAWFHQVKVPNWPFNHQMDTLKAYSKHTRYGDFSEPGCGKTMPAQAHAILMAALGNKVVFTMPPRLIRQFQAEIKAFFVGIDNHLTIDHLDRGAVQKSKLMERWDVEGWPDILLISYDAFRQFNDRSQRRVVPRNQWKLPPTLWADPHVPESYWKRNADGEQVPVVERAIAHTKHGDEIMARKGKYKAKNREQMRLKNTGYNVFFFDEAHALCNPEARVWKSVEAIDMELCDDVALYLMTGTPIPTHLHNVYGLIKILNRKAYFGKLAFERQHCIIDREPFKRYLGYKDEDKIHANLYQNARRVQKRDVTDLPASLISVTPMSLAGAHKKLYDQVLLERFAVLGDKVLAPDNDSALRMLALQLISCPDEFDASGKIGKDNELTKWMDQVVDSVNPAQNKLIIFAYFKSTVKFLSNRYAKWNPAVMNGATNKGWEEVERFKNDPTCRVFVVNWGSGGAGLNLQVAHHSAFYEVPTSPKDAKQAMARTDRTGQKETCNYYFPRVVGTLFDKNFKNLLKNERSNNLVVRDKHDLLYDQLNVNKRKSA